MRASSGAVATACAAAWATFVAVLIPSVTNSWHQVLQWLFVRDSSAAWWVVGVTAAAGVAAIWAGFSAYAQLQLLRDQQRAETESLSAQLEEMKASREAALRPHLVVEPDLASGREVIEIVNVGSGPALHFRARAEIDRGARRISFHLNAVAAGATRYLPLTEVENPEVWECTLTNCTYEDLFGNQFQHPSIFCSFDPELGPGWRTADD